MLGNWKGAEGSSPAERMGSRVNMGAAAQGNPTPAPASPPPATESAPSTPQSAPEPTKTGDSFAEKFKGRSEPTKDTETPASTPTNRLKIKANGEEREIDLSDHETLKKDLELAHGARRAFTDLDKTRKERDKLAADNKALAEYKSAFDELKTLKEKNPAQLFERIYGVSPTAFAEAETKRRQSWENASPEQRRAMELEQQYTELKKQADMERAERQSLLEQATNKEQAIRQRQVESSFVNEFDKFKFAGKVADADTASEMDKILFSTVQSNVAQWVEEQGNDDLDEIPQEIIRKEFERVSKFLGRINDAEAERKVQELDRSRSVRAKENAQLASTTNYETKTPLVEELAKFGGRPTDFFKQRRR